MNHCEHMKNLILINGTMGAGKTTVSRALQKILPDAVFLDGDWCWDADPFLVTEETKRMVMENITFLLAQFLGRFRISKRNLLLGYARTAYSL